MTQHCRHLRTSGLMLHAVTVLVVISAYLGCCLSATQVPGNDGLDHRDRLESTTTVQLQVRPQTNQTSRQEVDRVVSRQRASLLYWVLLVGGAGLGAIILLSLLTLLFHKLRRRSHSVDMRQKSPSLGRTAGLQTGGQKQTVTDRNYTNVATLAPPTTRVTDSVFSWGSEFDVPGDQRDNVYSNDYKIPPPDHHRKDGSKPANKDNVYSNDYKISPPDHHRTDGSKPANKDIYVNNFV